MYIRTNRTSQVFNDLNEEYFNCHIDDNNNIILDTSVFLQAFVTFLADYNQEMVKIEFDFNLSKVEMTFTS